MQILIIGALLMGIIGSSQDAAAQSLSSKSKDIVKKERSLKKTTKSKNTPGKVAKNRSAPKRNLASPMKSDVHIIPLHPHLDLEHLRKKGVVVHSPAYIEKDRTRIPASKSRDLVFQKAKIIKEVGTMDEMEKDMLFMRAGYKTENDLAKNYPAVPRAKLKQLRVQVLAYREQK